MKKTGEILKKLVVSKCKDDEYDRLSYTSRSTTSSSIPSIASTSNSSYWSSTSTSTASEKKPLTDYTKK